MELSELENYIRERLGDQIHRFYLYRDIPQLILRYRWIGDKLFDIDPENPLAPCFLSHDAFLLFALEPSVDETIPGRPTMPFAFSDSDAKQIIAFLDRHYTKNDFQELIIHCQAGVSRSHAVALFAAKYYEKDENLYKTLLEQEGKVYGGNRYVFNKLENYAKI